ncbi:MAG: hypothetical protein A4E59_00663 [Syntrophorhabdus sp. PtaB.Bin027]|jgi:hypothetical protein|nr:MAG: hypothetical protein A4E59_00663 [Syntrophorhabdus sp. PtaB.Bin027]
MNSSGSWSFLFEGRKAFFFLERGYHPEAKITPLPFILVGNPMYNYRYRRSLSLLAKKYTIYARGFSSEQLAQN